MNGLRTQIFARGYHNDFDYNHIGDSFLNVEEASKLIKKEIIDTAEVIKVVQYRKEGLLTIHGNYKPFEPRSNSGISQKQQTK